MDDQGDDEQDINVLEVEKSYVARELQKLGLRLLVSYPQGDRVDWLFPRLPEEEDDLLLA